MLRNRSPVSVLQKAYDESYLTCSTAVYYEGQGNEDEAMRCWKSALDQIYDHNANKLLPNYVPKSETERALVESLRQLELQCKERIDLLEALRFSRQDDLSLQSPCASSINPFRTPDRLSPVPSEKGWIGDGTIPAITYPELARPPPLPQRPSLPSRTSSEQTMAGSSRGTSLDLTRTPSAPRQSLPPYNAPNSSRKKSSRSPSPEKFTMRTTLRPNRSGDKPAKSSRKLSKTPDGPGANKAATLAWSALASKDTHTAGRSFAMASPARPSSTINLTPSLERIRTPSSSSQMRWDSHTRRLVSPRETNDSTIQIEGRCSLETPKRSGEFPFPPASALSISAASSALNALSNAECADADHERGPKSDRTRRHRTAPPSGQPTRPPKSRISRAEVGVDENSDSTERARHSTDLPLRRKLMEQVSATTPTRSSHSTASGSSSVRRKENGKSRADSLSSNEDSASSPPARIPRRKRKDKHPEKELDPDAQEASSQDSGEEEHDEDTKIASAWKKRKAFILKNLPAGVDEHAAKQILNEIVVRGDEVHWSDVAGLEIAKTALKENVVYPFLRPDLFMGLREPARGMLLFGPPGTGKTMLARAVATESKSTFFSISASSLTSKYLGESEKLVRALFVLAKVLAPSIIFVDEIDSLLSQRSGLGEHESTRRIKTEFLIQWSDLQRAAAGRDVAERDKERGDANRVLVLAATNLPWAIDEAARRRFVRRQYIPLPEEETRLTQFKTLLGQQTHNLSDQQIDELVGLTDGFSGSDITALAKDAAMGPLRSLGEALLQMSMDEIRPIGFSDFLASLTTIRPSVSKSGLKEYEDWAKEFGERGG